MDPDCSILRYRIPIPPGAEVGQRIKLVAAWPGRLDVAVPSKNKWEVDSDGRFFFLFNWTGVPKYKKWDDFTTESFELPPKFKFIDRNHNTSKCEIPTNGRRKALLIGINYIGTNSWIDVDNVYQMHSHLLKNGFQDKPESMMTLVNDQTYRIFNKNAKTLPKINNKQLPTKKNIQKGIQWLVQGAFPGDVLFFQYSGLQGTYNDKRIFVPLDHKINGHISYDEIWTYLVFKIPDGVKLIVIMDGFPSGPGIDLKYRHRQPNIFQQKLLNKTCEWKDAHDVYSAGDIVQFSIDNEGCEIPPTDLIVTCKSLSQAFIKVTRKNTKIVYSELLERMAENLPKVDKLELTSSQKFRVEKQLFSFASNIVLNKHDVIGKIQTGRAVKTVTGRAYQI